MSETNEQPMSLGKIFLILCGIAVLIGMTLGGISSWIGLSGGIATSGVGAGVGACAGFLLLRRQALLDKQKNASQD